MLMKNGPDSLNLVSIHSHKGGVGKTTLAAVLAAALAQRGQEVCLLDLDLLAPALATVLGVEDPGLGIGEFLFLMRDDKGKEPRGYRPEEVCRKVGLPWAGAGDLGVWLVPGHADYELARSAQSYLMAEERSGLLEARLEILLEGLRKKLGITTFVLDLAPSLFGMSGAVLRLAARRNQSVILVSTPTYADLRGTQVMLNEMFEAMQEAKDNDSAGEQEVERRSSSLPRMAFLLNRCRWEFGSANPQTEVMRVMRRALGKERNLQDAGLVERWLSNFERVGTLPEIPDWRRLSEVRLDSAEPPMGLGQVVRDDIRNWAEWLQGASRVPGSS